MEKLLEKDDPIIVDHLINLVESYDIGGRYPAVELLGYKKDPRAVKSLVHALYESDEATRYQITIALARIGGPSRKILSNLTLKSTSQKANKKYKEIKEKALENLNNPDFLKVADKHSETLRKNNEWLSRYRKLP